VGDKRISYGEVATAASKLPVPEVKLRQAGEWKYIGRPQKRLDSHEKINGRAIYGMDIRFPDLPTALVARSQVFGAKVRLFDASRAKAVPGVQDVVQVPSGIAVIADNFWAAKLGRGMPCR
jgi:isoquinoline 1-oxidoreductase beta subunit